FLAINSDVRSQRYPNVPTYAEAGYPGVAVGTWWGLLGPGNMSPALLQQLNAEFVKASKDPELIRRFAEQDLETNTMTPPAFLSMVQQNQTVQGKAIKQLGIKLE